MRTVPATAAAACTAPTRRTLPCATSTAPSGGVSPSRSADSTQRPTGGRVRRPARSGRPATVMRLMRSEVVCRASGPTGSDLVDQGLDVPVPRIGVAWLALRLLHGCRSWCPLVRRDVDLVRSASLRMGRAHLSDRDDVDAPQACLWVPDLERVASPVLRTRAQQRDQRLELNELLGEELHLDIALRRWRPLVADRRSLPALGLLDVEPGGQGHVHPCDTWHLLPAEVERVPVF